MFTFYHIYINIYLIFRYEQSHHIHTIALYIVLDKKRLASTLSINFFFKSYLKSHKSLMLLDTTNINTNLIVEVKNKLLSEGDCKFLHGKKASFSKRIRQMSEEQNNPKLLKLVDIMHGDVLLFFTNNSVSAAARKVEEYHRMGQAVYSRPSLVDYWIEPQLTRLANEMTRVFQKLRVPTKITKGNMEITHQ